MLDLRRTLVEKRPEVEGVRGRERGDATRVWFRDPSSIRFK